MECKMIFVLALLSWSAKATNDSIPAAPAEWAAPPPRLSPTTIKVGDWVVLKKLIQSDLLSGNPMLKSIIQKRNILGNVKAIVSKRYAIDFYYWCNDSNSIKKMYGCFADRV